MKERKGFYIRLDDDDIRIIQELKKIHAVNISQLLKNALREYHRKMEKEEG